MATIFHRRSRWPLFWMLSRMRILGRSPEKRRKKRQKGKGGYTQKLWRGALDGQNEGHEQIPYRLADEVSLLIRSNFFFDPVTVTIPIFCSSPLTSHSHILPVPTIRLESGADGSKTLTTCPPNRMPSWHFGYWWGDHPLVLIQLGSTVMPCWLCWGIGG